jgi:hypothetical protein
LKLHGIFYDILVGIPGGLLIFMGMLMFNAVLSVIFPTGPWMMLLILCFTSLVVGMLARLTRPFHAFGTASASGIVAALIIFYLQLASKSGAGLELVFGPAGMLVTITFSLLGAWIFPRLRKKTK